METVAPDSFSKAVAALSAGQAVVFPTDTVYGIGVAVGKAPRPQALYDIKRRDANKAIPWLVASPHALDAYGCDVPAYARAYAKAFWPGPLTIIVKAAPHVPEAFRAEDGTIALRMPDNPVALALIDRVGVPLATSSANFQGECPPRRFEDVSEALLARVGAAVADGVALPDEACQRGEGVRRVSSDEAHSGVSSTVVDCTGVHPRLLRQGAITQLDLDRCFQA